MRIALTLTLDIFARLWIFHGRVLDLDHNTFSVDVLELLQLEFGVRFNCRVLLLHSFDHSFGKRVLARGFAKVQYAQQLLKTECFILI